MSTPLFLYGGDFMKQILDMTDTTSSVMTKVQAYIDMYIFNSAVWDELEDNQKLKAIYNAHRILVRMLPDIFNEDSAGIDDLVSQIMWIIKRDDSTDRAEQGATMITLGDMSMMFDSSKTGVIISPEIIERYGLTPTGQKRKVGSYILPHEDTARTGFYKGDKERFRYV